jgi:crotonobetainyl-CoA:carnitine CoA-transferase CaiB-like acyl-CoA transferase
VPLVASPIRMSATPAAYERPPPRLGEHTDEVLREVAGLPDERIAALRAKGVL